MGLAVSSTSQHLPLHTDFEQATVASSTAREHEEEEEKKKKKTLLSNLDQNCSSLHSLTSNIGTAANAFALRVLHAQKKEKIKKK